MDFAKVFDKVDHRRLILKLAAAGVEGKLLAWNKDWLRNIYQHVVVSGGSSDWHPVNSGIPQGTVLCGPLFEELVKALLCKLADDTKMAQAIANREIADCFQNNIDHLIKWAKDWAELFN